MTKPAGDVPVSLEAWLSLLRAQKRLTASLIGISKEECGISLAWYDVLFQLSIATDGRLRMSELAAAVLLSQSGLTRLVDRMEIAGLVLRSAVPGDRRSLHVRVTPAALKRVTRARQIVRQSVERHFGRHLTERELATIRDLLARVAVIQD